MGPSAASSSPHRLAPLEQALAPIAAALRPVEPALVDVGQAIGSVAADAIVAAGDRPAGAIALRRGFAVKALDLVGASAQGPVPLLARPPLVEAGGALPAGTDAVLEPDAIEDQGAWLAALEAPPPGHLVRLRGHDVRAGEIVLAAGDVLTPEAALAARLAGVAQVSVRRPAVAIEIADEALSGWLAARLLALGCRLDPWGAVVLREAGDAAPRLALATAESAWIEARDGRVEIAIPQRFDGAVAAYAALVLPVLGRLLDARPQPMALPLGAKVSSALGLAELILLRREGGSVRPLSVGEMTLTTLAKADCFLIIGPQSEGHPAGASVEALSLSAPFRSASS